MTGIGFDIAAPLLDLVAIALFILGLHFLNTPATARLLTHWRHHNFETMRPFFCQVEAVETIIWLTEVARLQGRYAKFWEHLKGANEQINPELMRIAMKMATGSGKTTVMAMLIAWQTVNAVRSPTSNLFSRGFLIITAGITIRDRLRVLGPDDPDNYYRTRELPARHVGRYCQDENERAHLGN